MLHKIAHNARRPHNTQFYKLWDELRKFDSTTDGVVKYEIPICGSAMQNNYLRYIWHAIYDNDACSSSQSVPLQLPVLSMDATLRREVIHLSCHGSIIPSFLAVKTFFSTYMRWQAKLW
uniref:WLM domain-containing protein n=1 Tax=Triticum urartu TaxID=4572 RepID=A0A8R7QAN2_TRIUA